MKLKFQEDLTVCVAEPCLVLSTQTYISLLIVFYGFVYRELLRKKNSTLFGDTGLIATYYNRPLIEAFYRRELRLST